MKFLILLLSITLASCQLLPYTTLKWSKCGTGNEAINLTKVEAHPMPLRAPGNITVAGAAHILKDIVKPIKARVSIEKYINGGWINFPICYDDIGSCSYPDICKILDDKLPPGKECPEVVRKAGLPCHCPFKAGTYEFKEQTFSLPAVKVPPQYAMLANGGYRATVKAWQGNDLVFCNIFTVSLQLGS